MQIIELLNIEAIAQFIKNRNVDGNSYILVRF